MQATEQATELLFVTGGSSGIGRAMVDACPSAGTRAINLSRRAADGSLHVAVDLSDPAGWEETAATFERELRTFKGKRAVLVHSAGTLTPIGFAGEMDAAA
ncbi:MAG: short-chain dehydrogenase, partial [Myxococcales bacterium]|nr:short-chain dehydrogenase [Myxococcales bacterium]